MPLIVNNDSIIKNRWSGDAILFSDVSSQILKQKYINRGWTKYNKNKIRSICDMCKKEVGTEIHHMQYQRDAINGYIVGGSLNNAANLMSVCENVITKFIKKINVI